MMEFCIRYPSTRHAISRSCGTCTGADIGWFRNWTAPRLDKAHGSGPRPYPPARPAPRGWLAKYGAPPLPNLSTIVHIMGP